MPGQVCVLTSSCTISQLTACRHHGNMAFDKIGPGSQASFSSAYGLLMVGLIWKVRVKYFKQAKASDIALLLQYLQALRTTSW